MPDAPDDRPTIVIAIDGLRPAALGAYGQTAYETPAFDTLAADAVTYDWCYAPTPHPFDLYSRLAERLEGFTLVTDDQRHVAPLLDRAAKVHTIDHLEPAVSGAPTAMSIVWAKIAEQTVEWASAEESSLLWVHTRGLYGPWDAPASLYESLFDEDDPPCDEGSDPPDHVLAGDELHEAAFLASCRYAGQVMVLDSCLAAWFDLVEGLMEGIDYRLIVSGLRGLPLGEHGRVGGTDERLYSEQQQAPLFVCEGDPATRFTRDASPVSLETALLSRLVGEANTRPAVSMRSNEAEALVTADRLLRQPLGDSDDAELYVKPDDRWEQNDIASLEEETVEQLQGVLARGGPAGESGVAADGQRG
ncbi:hypothetical protein MalM25_13850 [Planctomycetes bacterium MalM25]|nr:hypothetical protein MalM25_13850 [Planctomycetes bacterium MalM25]